MENINLSVKAGECILLCGRSGCGKTTITKLINGLIPHYFSGELSGNVKVDSLNAFQTPMYQLAKKVGSVFQNPRTQFFNVDVDSEIAFGIENEAVPPDELHRRLDDIIDALKMKHLRGRNIFELSGGEKQKIAFASVYAMNPDVYLLDEPSSNLDMASIYDLKAYLHLLKQQGKTILIAEHRLYYLMDVADRIVYLSEGQIKAIHTPESFCALSDSARKSMGLRAVDLRRIHPKKRTKQECPVLLEVKDVFLFDDTVRENIRHARPEATNEEIESACRKANCDAFIRKMEKGYDTPIGENGNLISGGERQRLSIARAILKNSPILLLDEATASLDIENELAVKQAIVKLLDDEKTVIMIAHTLSIIKNADQILFVSGGRISESGTHEELLKKNGKYAAMWRAEQKLSI